MFIWQVSQLPKQLNLNSHYLNKNGILNCRSKLGCAVVFYYLGTHRHTDTQTHIHTDTQTHNCYFIKWDQRISRAIQTQWHVFNEVFVQ